MSKVVDAAAAVADATRTCSPPPKPRPGSDEFGTDWVRASLDNVVTMLDDGMSPALPSSAAPRTGSWSKCLPVGCASSPIEIASPGSRLRRSKRPSS